MNLIQLNWLVMYTDDDIVMYALYSDLKYLLIGS